MNVHRLVTHLWSNSSRKRANQKPLALRHPCAIDEAQYFVVPSAYTRIELSVHPVISTSAVGQFLIPANQGRKMLMKRSITLKRANHIHSKAVGEKNKRAQRFLNRRAQHGIAATTEGNRIGVSAYGRTGENDVLKPLSPERNPRADARSSMSVEQMFLCSALTGAF
jgi:hypothetical protein